MRRNVSAQLKGDFPLGPLAAHRISWPGNVRELENAIEHAMVLGIGDEIVPEDLPESLLEASISGKKMVRPITTALIS